MSKSPRKAKSSRPSKREPARITSAQILRQAVVIVVVVALWSALLVGYLALTPAGEEPPSTATATEPAASEAMATQPLPTPTLSGGTQVSFSADVLPIFEENCQRCHSATRPDAGLDLSSRAGLMSGSRGGAVVVSGNAAESRLIQVLATGRMPRGAPKLPDAEIQAISNWVDSGAPDN